MAGQTYTEVFNFSTAPITAAQMELTDVLDKLLGDVLNQTPHVDWIICGNSETTSTTDTRTEGQQRGTIAGITSRQDLR